MGEQWLVSNVRIKWNKCDIDKISIDILTLFIHTLPNENKNRMKTLVVSAWLGKSYLLESDDIILYV